MFRNRRLRLLACLTLTMLARAAVSDVGTAAPTALFDAQGYRTGQFLAPVPESVPGAITIDTKQVQRLIATAQALPIDVLPAPERPVNLPPDTLWLPPPHANIPGSTWLPNVGYGRLSARLESYLIRNLARLTQGDHAKPLIVYCRADCWMSWNAAKRIAALGYTGVYWYPDGTTGWKAAGLPLEPSQPIPMD